jgi:hypothetical protein
VLRGIIYCLRPLERICGPPGIKCRLNSRNACYHSLKNLLPSSLVPKNIKIKIYRTMILPIVFYGCETWSLTFREEQWLRVFENRVLKNIWDLKETRQKRTGGYFIISNCSPHEILFEWPKKDKWDVCSVLVVEIRRKETTWKTWA